MQNGYVYGPIDSKRLRRSLGVNLSPVDRKVCTFNCVYCHYGPTHVGQFQFPTVKEVAEALEARLKERPLVDYITFAGNGEPTMHPEFLEAVKAVRSLREKYCPGVPVSLLSNSTQLGRRDVLEAVKLIDLPIFKLDAGDANMLYAVNRPVSQVSIEEIIEWLRRLPSPNIQTVMVAGAVNTAQPPGLDSWLEAIGRIRPRLIQLYSPDRPIVSSSIEPVAPERLRKISRHIRDTLGFDVRVY
jgi:wyosine [tRNA(Phe)-imidazoG37] synthetase (radical SAM superfamily)